MSRKMCGDGDGDEGCKYGLPATVRFFWPGKEKTPNEVCALHGAWAQKIAETLGFELRTESMLTGEEGDAGPSRFSLLETD